MRLKHYQLTTILILIVHLFILSIQVNAEPFAIARVRYDGGGDWYCDPSSLVNLQSFMQSEFGMTVAEREAVVDIMDENLYSFPMLYMSGHGNIHFSPEEIDRLRDYLLGGGFLHVDDNYGLDESFRREISRVFPENELVELPFSHPIYHMVYDFNSGPPKIHEHDNLPAQGLAIIVDGRVVVFYTYQSDLGDGWEDEEVHNDPPQRRLAALQMGANIIMYALSGLPVDLP